MAVALLGVCVWGARPRTGAETRNYRLIVQGVMALVVAGFFSPLLYFAWIFFVRN